MMRFLTGSLALLLGLSSVTAQSGTGCTITRVGEGCGGATLTVTLTPSGNGSKRLVLTGTGMLPRSTCGFLFGIQQIAPTPVAPGSLCMLHTDYVWGHQLRSDNSGVASWNRAWPNSYLGYFYMQMGSIGFDAQGQVVFNISNCELVDCRPQ